MAFQLRSKMWAASTLMALALGSVPASGADETASPKAEPAKPDPARLEFFEKQVRPLLVKNCYNCHSADNKAAGGLRVDDHRGILAGGDSGKGVIPGDPDNSMIIKAVRQNTGLKMPPDNKLTDEQIAVLEQWIRDGAVWPAFELPPELLAEDPEYDRLRKEHWAWQPLVKAAAPKVQREGWALDDVDRFLLATLESRSIEPVADADKATWLRRVTFDLTGLPPRPEELAAFLADESADAYEKVVDRLLASTAYGEHWGRHWLDLARYGESTGSARNLPYPQAWRYRDYVIDSFNADTRYDRFLQEQIAGDLLPAESDEQRKQQKIATGFLALGVKDVNQRFKVRFEMDNVDEQIDTVTRSVLALTVSCARCHDHKFDPISTREYYGLAGIFQSTEMCSGLRNKMGGSGLQYYDSEALVILGTPSEMPASHLAKVKKAEKAVEAAKAEFERLRDSDEGLEKAPNGRPKRQMARQRWNRLQDEVKALKEPAAYSEIGIGVRDSRQPADTEIRIRGEAEQLGPVVARGFLDVIPAGESHAIPEGQSGRLQLAYWLTSHDNPLTRRVIVNRLWQHLFGEGLVRSVDNFGITGDVPTHPELLDHLANRFGEDGWSIKKHLRLLVLTRAYRLGSTATQEHLAVDPDNRFHWRHQPRRLTAEELRDATLVVSGRLETTRPNGSIAHELPVIELRNDGPESRRIMDYASRSRHRGVYLPLLRTIVPTSLEVFDFANQGLVTGHRETTTVPTQALYLLNNEFVRTESRELALKLLKTSQDDSARLNEAYLNLLGRAPTAGEKARALAYLDDYELAAQSAPSVAPVTDEVAVIDPDQDQTLGTTGQGDVPDEAPVAEPAVAQESEQQPTGPREEAWASLIQAVIGASEFRHLR